MNIKFKKVSENKADMKKVISLNHTAFPKQEQIPFWVAMWKSNKSFVDFFSIYDEDDWIGLIYMIHKDNVTFVFYFAIDDTKRGKGYGSLVIDSILKKYKSNRIVLNIESPDQISDNNKQRVSRKRFYLNNHFRETGLSFTEGGIEYEFLIAGEGDITKMEYLKLIRRYAGFLYMVLKPLRIVERNLKSF